MPTQNPSYPVRGVPSPQHPSQPIKLARLAGVLAVERDTVVKGIGSPKAGLKDVSTYGYCSYEDKPLGKEETLPYGIQMVSRLTCSGRGSCSFPPLLDQQVESVQLQGDGAVVQN